MDKSADSKLLRNSLPKTSSTTLHSAKLPLNRRLQQDCEHRCDIFKVYSSQEASQSCPLHIMTPYNAQWEAQIQGLRKNRRLLVARNIPFEATQAAFEADARARLTKPDSATFLWPPSSGRYDDPARHMGWVMLAFKERSDARMAEMDLKDYKFRDCQVRIGRASKIAVSLHMDLRLLLVCLPMVALLTQILASPALLARGRSRYSPRLERCPLVPLLSSLASRRRSVPAVVSRRVHANRGVLPNRLGS